MLNTRNEETNTAFYSYVACFVKTFTLNMYVSTYNSLEQIEFGRAAHPLDGHLQTHTHRVGIADTDISPYACHHRF